MLLGIQGPCQCQVVGFIVKIIQQEKRLHLPCSNWNFGLTHRHGFIKGVNDLPRNKLKIRQTQKPVRGQAGNVRGQ